MEKAADGEFAIDLEAQTITTPSGRTQRFEIDPFARRCLLEGLDAIGRTLQDEEAIAHFERTHASPIATTRLP
jgi:3-isopropylmalate/(R)-2-methylmalate dehydratase small subunit